MSDKAPYSVQYRIETGKQPFGEYDENGNVDTIPHDTSGLPNLDYVDWLCKKLRLAEARFRAGEKIFEQYGMTTDIMKSGYYRRLKHAISAYEAEVKGERNGHTKVR